jgi:hypothetical protein
MKTLRDESLKATAYHEAGHTLVAWLLRVKVRSATIVPDREAESDGHIRHEGLLLGKFPEAVESDRQRIRMEKFIMVSLAGPIAQMMYNPRSFRRYHAGFDWPTALNLSMMCTRSSSTSERHLAYLEARTKDLLEAPGIRELLRILATELLARKTLNRSEIALLCTTGMPPGMSPNERSREPNQDDDRSCNGRHRSQDDDE